jgi:hypothetical protein
MMIRWRRWHRWLDLFVDPLRPTHIRVRRARDAEADARDERSDRMLAELQERAGVTETYLRKRQRENHWQEAISRMIKEAG